LNAISNPSKENLRQAVDAFWETYPPFWRRVRARIRQVAAEQFGLSVEQFHILRHVRRGQGSVSELAEARHISRAAISQAVDTLVQKGLIARTTDVRDRRYIRLALTESGDALLDGVFDNVSQWMMQALSSLSGEDLDALVRAMDSLRKIQPA
jgi:DNA-binding MarR family transcriptional regulator